MPFFLPGQSTDTAYTFNRDHESRAWLRELLEEMWQKYEPICPDDGFPEKTMNEFLSCTWQMRLAVTLIENGHPVQRSGADAPDVLVVNHQNVERTWIDAVAPDLGTGNDRVQRPPRGHVYHPPENQIVLRLRAAIHDKTRQHQDWIRRRVVSTEEPFVIAVNGGKIPDADIIENGISYMEKAVFPLGGTQWHVALDTGDITDTTFTHRSRITKANNAEVATDIFLDASHASVSGVLYCPLNIINRYDLQGRDFLFIHNPSATNPLPRGFLPFGREKWVDGDYLYGRNHFEEAAGG